ncbi:terminase small subunit [Peptococcus simiae]|uniref:terminase small subunit n=1 Tax=Peptococcus simiae TaxID=1643805 RepID=UPI003980D70C
MPELELVAVGVNDRQRLFVDEYLKDLNATQAAIRAGYSEKTARSQGNRLLTKVDIKSAIKKRQEALQDENIATLKDIAEFLSLTMKGEMEEEVVLTLRNQDGSDRVVKRMKQASVRDRIKAAEQLARRLEAAGVGIEVEDLSAIEGDIYGD